MSPVLYDGHIVNIALVPPYAPNFKPALFGNIFPKGKQFAGFGQRGKDQDEPCRRSYRNHQKIIIVNILTTYYFSYYI
jgi:hypothetical protein